MDISDELKVAVGADSDIDFAFQLQIQEAIRASLASKPSSSNDDVFKVYFKGLVSDETVSNVKMSFAGIGVAICDTSGSCLFKSRKSFVLDAGGRGTEGDRVELEALTEALNVAVNHGFKRVRVFSDCNSVYQYLNGKRKRTNNKIETLIDQLKHIQSKFTSYERFHVEQNDIKFVYKLARDAITFEVAKWDNSDSGVTITEQCKICFEYTDSGNIYTVNTCRHRYCFSCIRKHAEARLLQGMLPDCPHEKCESKIGIERCKKLLKPELYNIMRSRVKEASIPLTDKVYCPFPSCSALMSKDEVKEHTPTSSSTAAGDTGMRKCVECNRHFCINCKVPWHDNITCSDYVNSSKFRSSAEAKLKSLATKKHWRECIKCKNLVELAMGCYHIYCRCGYEFCYTCGAEWVNKKPTCKCPLWNERNILYAQPHRNGW
ncbi:putative transcription factor C2H2 family [Helianthus debilis subsp. tardiflorus]